MISATSLNSAPSPHSLAKPAPIPIGLENGRLRVDSQKFLVPPLPVSARSLSHASDPKKRDRLPANNGVLHIHENHLNGMRRQYGLSQTSHQHHQHLPTPRKDAKSPVYNGDTIGSTGIPSNPNSFPMRSALPYRAHRRRQHPRHRRTSHNPLRPCHRPAMLVVPTCLSYLPVYLR